MRKIDKKCTLSYKYIQWLRNLEKKGSNHPDYNSQFRFYWDIVMNLFHCQIGLCAYTEKKLCSEAYYQTNKWKEGRYKRSNYVPNKPKIKGNLEHFNPNLKSKKGWLWSNLFMADSDINNRAKGMLRITSRLKPDSSNYDEFSLFEYDVSKHIFRANSKLNKKEQELINPFIDAIMNYDTVIDDRRNYLSPRLKLIEFGLDDWNTIEIDEFPTSFEMIKRQSLIVRTN